MAIEIFGPASSRTRRPLWTAEECGAVDDAFWRMVLSLYRSHIFRFVPTWRLEQTKRWAPALKVADSYDANRK